MSGALHLFMFVDALGWEIVREHSFAGELLPYRYPVGMQFGYSSTAIPTILSGQSPVVHRHLSFYYFSPATSPFRSPLFRLLGLLPSPLSSHWRVRHRLSRLIGSCRGYTGYFELYAMPFRRLGFFDYSAKTDLFAPGGLRPVRTIVDDLHESGVPFHISNWRTSEQANIDALCADLARGRPRFAFLYTASMDSLLHRCTKAGEEVAPKLRYYEGQLRRILSLAHDHYDDVHVSVMSDHGMTTLAGVVDVRGRIEGLGLSFGRDYAAAYDSTMARFWFMSGRARAMVVREASRVAHAHLLSAEERLRYGIDFEDAMYGEEYLLMDAGWQIAPSDMGLSALPGMHGFAPEHEDSFASYLSTAEPSGPPLWVGDYYRLMQESLAELMLKQGGL